MPKEGISLMPFSWKKEISARPGDFPLPFMPTILFCFARYISAKASPPNPAEWGSTTFNVLTIATAASTAFPPCASILYPERVARG